VPLAPLPFCSASFAFTVVSAAALIGRHRIAEAAASMSELRNLVISPASGWEHTRVLGGDVMSNHSTPDIGSRCPWTPKHLPPSVSAAHFCTMPGTGSVHTALDLDEGLKSERFAQPACGQMASNPFPHGNALERAAAQLSRSPFSGTCPTAMRRLQ
jgi:hypothetical protein